MIDGIMVYQGEMPMPLSHHSKKASSLRPAIREAVAVAMCGLTLQRGADYTFDITGYGTWLNVDGTRKIKDVHNRLRFLLDDIAFACGIDDSDIRETRVRRVESPSGDEWVAVAIYCHG